MHRAKGSPSAGTWKHAQSRALNAGRFTPGRGSLRQAPIFALFSDNKATAGCQSLENGHFFGAGGENKLSRWTTPELFPELRNPAREPRDFALRRIAVQHALPCGANECRLGGGHGGDRTRAIAGGDRLLDLAQGSTHARAARFVDRSAAGNLTSCLLGGFCIGHDYQTAFEEEALIGVRRPGVNAGRAMRLPGLPATAAAAARRASRRNYARGWVNSGAVPGCAWMTSVPPWPSAAVTKLPAM